MIEKEKDADSSLQCYITFMYWPRWDVFTSSMLKVPSEPVAKPPAFKGLQNLSAPIWNSESVKNLKDIIKELDIQCCWISVRNFSSASLEALLM